jgi:teichuronic acid biosynthesis glycosyltransferase TuaG
MTIVKQDNQINKKNKKRALFSIIIPCYNAAKSIERTLQALSQQSLKDFEAIVINDGSIDQSLQLINNFISKDPRFKLLNLTQNQGLSHARNLGLDYSRGKYICFLDSDDWWPSDKLEVFESYFNKGYDFLYSDYTRVHEISKKEYYIKVKKEIKYEDLLMFNPIPLSTVAFASNKFGMIKFRDIKLSEDWIYWLDLFKKKIRPFGINKNLMFYSVSDNALSSNKFKMMFRAWHIYRNYHRISFLKATIFLVSFIMNGIKKRL